VLIAFGTEPTKFRVPIVNSFFPRNFISRKSYRSVPILGMVFCCTQYERIPPDAPNARCCGVDWTWFWAYLAGGDLSDAEKVALQGRMTRMRGVDNVETFEIHAESVRQIAYVMFWIKILLAAVFTNGRSVDYHAF
jgi:hypothetical protein